MQAFILLRASGRRGRNPRIYQAKSACQRSQAVLLTVLERVNLFGEDPADALLALVDVMVPNRVDYELLQLREFTQARRRDFV